ncbi:MAG: hypothetical protein N2109_13680, partial [Fimbriimonadales bacterium]|nr:hypothetical protein [Fimbriimonadales bacterium]
GDVYKRQNLETRKLLEQKRELRAHLEWLINHLQGQNIVEEVRGIYRALIYTALSNRLIDFFSTLFRTGTFVTFGWLDHYFERLVWSLQRAPRTDFAIESASMTVPPVDFLRTVTTLPRAAAAVRDAYRATVWPYFKEMFLRLVTGKKHANIEFKAAKEFLQQPSEKFGASSWTTLHAHVKGEHL